MSLTGLVGAVQFPPELLGEPGRRMIVMLPDQLPGVHRFTLAHELGHIVLGHTG